MELICSNVVSIKLHSKSYLANLKYYCSWVSCRLPLSSRELFYWVVSEKLFTAEYKDLSVNCLQNVTSTSQIIGVKLSGYILSGLWVAKKYRTTLNYLKTSPLRSFALQISYVRLIQTYYICHKVSFKTTFFLLYPIWSFF